MSDSIGASGQEATGLSSGDGAASVSTLRASIPDADDLAPPTSADVYRRTAPAIKVMAEAAGCDYERAAEILKALVEGGYYIAPRIPTDPMLYAYFLAYGQQAWSPRTIIQNIGKARMRWQAMGQAGTAMSLSRKFLAQGIEARRAEAGIPVSVHESPVATPCAQPSAE